MKPNGTNNEPGKRANCAGTNDAVCATACKAPKQHAARDPDGSTKKLSDAGTLVKHVLVILYPIGTILGLIYAHWYYKEFNISFLNHATPLDLLLVALANADKITLVFAFAIPLTIVLHLVLWILVVANWGLAAILAVFFAVATFWKILRSGVVVGITHIFVVVLALPISLAIMLKLLTIVLFDNRATVVNWLREVPKKDDRSPSARLHRSSQWWLRIRSRAICRRTCVLPKIYRDWKCANSSRFNIAKENRKSRTESLRKNLIAVFLLILTMTSAFIAIRSGVVDSKCISEENGNDRAAHCNFERGFIGQYKGLVSYGEELLIWVGNQPLSTPTTGGGTQGDGGADRGDGVPQAFGVQLGASTRNDGGAGRGDSGDDGDKVILGRPIVVPTANVAALEYLDNDPDSTRRHVRVTIRQSAGHHGLSRCLTDIGATDSAQFLFDFDNDREYFAKREECLSRQGASGGCERAASIKFPRRSATLDGTRDQKRDHIQECKPRRGCTDGSGRCSRVDCLVELINAKADDDLIPAKLRLIGRADVVPINNGSSRSNAGLAQARAEEVWRLLRLKGWEWLDGVDVLRLIGGPLSPGNCDTCDRSVDVHICWKPVGAENAGGGGVDQSAA